MDESAACSRTGCDGRHYARGLCGRCYHRARYHGTLEQVALPSKTPSFPESRDECDRCTKQLGALAADRGKGDRPLLAGTMTLSEASAYMLGAFDRRSASGGDAIDPYIVTRFHELRAGVEVQA